MNQSILILHWGAAKVERAQLTRVETPEGDRFWCPIPHDTLVSEVMGALTRANMRIVTEAHGLSADGLRYFGLLQIANGDEQGDYSYVLGLRNSHDKRFPAGLVVGSAVFVCYNLAFSGEIKIARKHTRFVMRDLPGLVSGAIGQLGERWHEQAERIDAYRRHELNDVQAHDLVVRALDNRAITVQGSRDSGWMAHAAAPGVCPGRQNRMALLQRSDGRRKGERLVGAAAAHAGPPQPARRRGEAVHQQLSPAPANSRRSPPEGGVCRRTLP